MALNDSLISNPTKSSVQFIVVPKTFNPVKASTGRHSQPSYIPTLDGWRAVAVCLVIGAHCDVILGNNGSWLAMRFAALFAHAGYGVDIFFALSGFLICTLLLREKERCQTISISRFYTRRVFRILPPMLLYVIFVSCLATFRPLPKIGKSELFAVLFFYRNYAVGTWYTAHFWSLAGGRALLFVCPALHPVT